VYKESQVPEYITVPIETDPDVLTEDSFDFLQTQVVGWVPAEGNFEVWLIEMMARMVSQVRDIASLVPTTIFRYFGDTLIGVHPIDASSATAYSTWTMVDNQGYVIPAGTQITMRTPTGEDMPFVTVGNVVVPPGNLETLENEVLLSAVFSGAASSGLTNPVTLVDVIPFVLDIQVDDVSTGGVNAETDIEYLNRLVAQLQLLAPRPILPQDFAAMARNISGVWRALALDGYKPTPPPGTYNNERYCTVAVMDVAGNPLSGAVKGEVDAYLESHREVNFIVEVIDPTVTQIDVQTTIQSLPENDPSSLQLSVELAIKNYLNPARWGIPPGSLDTHEWMNELKVRYLEVAQVINNVPGVDFIVSLSTAIHGGSFAQIDLDIAGAAPVAKAATIVVTVQ
jgi:Baseplate J-like protein